MADNRELTFGMDFGLDDAINRLGETIDRLEQIVDRARTLRTPPGYGRSRPLPVLTRSETEPEMQATPWMTWRMMPTMWAPASGILAERRTASVLP